MLKIINANMIFINIIFLVLIASVLGKNCDKLGILIYEDLGCTPNTPVCKTTCPSKYSCQGLEPTSKNCVFRGKTYQENEEVPSNITRHSCLVSCSCQTGAEKLGSSFACAAFDCADLLAGPNRTSCYMKFSLDECCPVGVNCPPFDNVAKCKFGGKTYLEGQSFSSKNTCQRCVCQKGFKGKLEEPFCKRFDCFTQINGYGSDVQSRCAPVYDANLNDVLCCPYSWICPDGTEIIKGSVKTGDTCKFGDKTLSIGQKFKKVNATDNFENLLGNVICECVVPPLLRCLKA